jgi:hypothetical protein
VAFSLGVATDISARFQDQPDGSLLGTISDAEVGSTNKNLHIIATPADGGEDIASDFEFGPTVGSRLQQPIDDLLVEEAGENEVQGADGRTTIGLEPGSLLAGNDTETPSLEIATHNLETLGGEPDDDGQLVGDGVELVFDNTQADPDRTISMSFPVDTDLIEGDVTAEDFVIYVQNPDGSWSPITEEGQCGFDPVTQTVEADVSVDEHVNNIPLVGINPLNASRAAASASRPRMGTMSAIRTSKSVSKNPRAAAAVSGIFSVGLVSSTGTVAATEYHQYNFPNPFNLKDKTVTLRGATTGVPTSIRGTYIVVAPTGTGTVSIKVRIYNVAGDLVRELKGDDAIASRYNYFHWDGKNTAGDDVASGVYFASVDAPGAPKREPIKMVLVK